MSGYVLTITAAKLPEGAGVAVTDAFRQVTRQLPHMVLHTFLIKEGRDDWRIVTLWRSREQLEEYRREAGVPAAIKIFRDAGAEPTVTEHDVEHWASSG
ncbi:MAG TPA: hypothetical protein VF054_11575 [Micromonosporaceae bacterium]